MMREGASTSSGVLPCGNWVECARFALAVEYDLSASNLMDPIGLHVDVLLKLPR